MDTPQTADLSSSALPHIFRAGAAAWLGHDLLLKIQNAELEYLLCFYDCLSNLSLIFLLHLFYFNSLDLTCDLFVIDASIQRICRSL